MFNLLADYNTGTYLVVAEVREMLSVSKWAMQKFDMETFNFKELNGVEVNNIRLKSQTGMKL
jgi:hypothetical protein